MEETLIRDLFRQAPDKECDIAVSGWVRTVRDSKAFGFIELNDGTHFRNLQVVLEQEKLSGFRDLMRLGLGTAIRVEGTLVPTPEARQPFELKAAAVQVLGECDPSFPLQKKRHSPEYLRTIAHLRPRTNLYYAVFRVRSLAAFAIHKFLQERGFVYVHTPIVTASDCEGAGEMFRVTTLPMGSSPRKEDGSVDFGRDFFGKEANLTVSGQLNVECFAMAFRNVYTFGPTFRAEKSITNRHAAEFWMVEPEIAFADLSDDMQLSEDMVKYVIRYLLDSAPEEMAFLNQFVDKGLLERLEGVASAEFGRVSYTDAVRILQTSGRGFEFPVEWGLDLQTEHERYLTEEYFKKPVFVMNYPKEIKAFYMRLNDDGRTVAAADMEVPGIGELVGGSQREERLDVLQRRMRELGLREEDYWWYLELRKFGGCKHAGFGIGFERLVMYVTGVQNIRDVLPFPRTYRNAEF